ncbi:hypothetical protein [Devosia sp. 2618]|uniref:hypothetical protein n=1 Tax=Devosia sp. 2618 TaxID=3156454 RepID=UPI003396A56F
MNQTPHAGPGLWIQIQHRFGPRIMEWFMAFHTLMFGLVLLASPDLFNQPAWAGFRAVFPSGAALGWIMVVLGVARIGGLIVNGARRHVTPMIRQVSAGVGCLIWFGIVYGFASSGVVSTWLAIYPLFGIGELVNIHRAAHDQGETRRGKAS